MESVGKGKAQKKEKEIKHNSKKSH